MSNLVIIVPSRGRPSLMKRFLDSWKLTTQGKSTIRIGLDANDPNLMDYIKSERNVYKTVFTSQLELNQKNNLLAMSEIEDGANIVGLLSDDFIFHTLGWEDKIIEWQDQNKGICYGNDLLQGAALPTAPFIHEDIILPLGYTAPPILKHYYIDNYWLELGLRLEKIKYLPDIVIEHSHWSNKKAIKDLTYSQSEALMGEDKKAWDHYRETKLSNDVQKIQLWHKKLK